MLKFPNGHKYKLVYLDTNAMSEIAKNKNNTFKNFFEYFHFFKNNDSEHYAFVTSVYNLCELNKTREDYKNKIIKSFDLIPVLIVKAFPQNIQSELNSEDFVLFATGPKPLLQNQFSTLFKQLNSFSEANDIFNNHINEEIKTWNEEKKLQLNESNLLINSYKIYDTSCDDYNIIFNSNCAKIFSFIKYQFLYEKNKEIDSNSIIDSYNASIAPLVDVYVGERTVTSWLNKSKDKYDFMKNIECIKISYFYDK